MIFIGYLDRPCAMVRGDGPLTLGHPDSRVEPSESSRGYGLSPERRRIGAKGGAPLSDVLFVPEAFRELGKELVCEAAESHELG
jgi:hypothetical protein